MTRKGRSWWTFGGKLHVEQIRGSLVSYCSRDLSAAAPTTHPATWRDACRHCTLEILREEIPALLGAAT